MSNVTYGRGQAEWALWKTFVRSGSNKGDVSKVFRTRVKRLLEIDRALDLSNRDVVPSNDFAFVAPPEIPGGEVAFASFDTFCLAVALDILDAGFKQSEVVFLMRHLRIDLEEYFIRMREAPDLNARVRYSPKKHPNLPTYRHNGKEYADPRTFVVVRKKEFTEALPSGKPTDRNDPMFLEPQFCDGIMALNEVLSDLLPNRGRVATVVELTATAQAVCAFLEQAPEIRRGRPKS